MGNFMSSDLWIVVFVAFLKGHNCGNITVTKYTISENCIFPSVDIASITIATFVYGMMRCAAKCSSNVQCTGYLLEIGEIFKTIFNCII